MSDFDDIARSVLRAAGVARPGAPERIGHGESGDVVFRFDGDPVLFAKIGDPASRISRAELAREAAALGWLEGRAPAPRPVWTGQAAGRPAMLTEAVTGVALHAVAPEAAEASTIAALGALARLHALPIGDCPFDERLDVKLAESHRRVEAEEIEIDRLDPENAATPPKAILADLVRRRPADEDLVVTHGDACCPNFILQPDGGVAIIDLGRFGVADRHHDLALFVRSTRRNFPDLDAEGLLAQHYPVEADPEKLTYYRQLDELY